MYSIRRLHTLHGDCHTKPTNYLSPHKLTYSLLSTSVVVAFLENSVFIKTMQNQNKNRNHRSVRGRGRLSGFGVFMVACVRKSHGTQVSTEVMQHSGPTQRMSVIVTTKYVPHILSCLWLPENPSLVPHVPEESSRRGKSLSLPSTAQQSWLLPSPCPGTLPSGGGRQTYGHK